MQEERARNYNIRKLGHPGFGFRVCILDSNDFYSVLACSHCICFRIPIPRAKPPTVRARTRIIDSRGESSTSANFGHRVLAFAFATFSEQRLRQRFGVHALLSTPTFSTRKTNIASHASASDTHPFCTRSYYNNHRWHSLTWAFNTLLNQLCAFALHYRALPSWYWT